ncbi:MAG: hypothetical protein QME96_18545 [Myxococcota bacterium]|nr:hypothetical protein [Myxococcota bacterium]
MFIIPACSSPPRGVFAAVFCLALGLSVPEPARARAQEVFAYSRDIVWNTAVRLLRVDLGYEIVEQDKENGYILFQFARNGRTYGGSVEFVEGTGEHDARTIDVSLTVGGLPEAVERDLLRKLKAKLRSDYGLPVRPPRPAPPAEPPAEPPATDPPAAS